MNIKISLIAIAALTLFSSVTFKATWTDLLDKDLSKWEMYLSFRHKDGYKGEVVLNKNGEEVKPVGYNNNISNVFSVQEEKGKPVLRISGEIYGCVFTKEVYQNYHLKLKVKWGNKKWVPRLNEEKDSGILYHSQGACGVDYWRSWMLSQEFQIIEKSMGDYWCIANSRINIQASKAGGKETFICNRSGLVQPFGFGTGNGNFCQAEGDHEVKNGEWNTLELITYGDKSLHIVNGHVVMALSGSAFVDEKGTHPLTKGKIQLQSEAAEVFFKDIQIRQINKMPEAYKNYYK